MRLYLHGRDHIFERRICRRRHIQETNLHCLLEKVTLIRALYKVIPRAALEGPVHLEPTKVYT